MTQVVSFIFSIKEILFLSQHETQQSYCEDHSLLNDISNRIECAVRTLSVDRMQELAKFKNVCLILKFNKILKSVSLSMCHKYLYLNTFLLREKAMELRSNDKSVYRNLSCSELASFIYILHINFNLKGVQSSHITSYVFFFTLSRS
jgi:hypothetical protein